MDTKNREQRRQRDWDIQKDGVAGPLTKGKLVMYVRMDAVSKQAETQVGLSNTSI